MNARELLEAGRLDGAIEALNGELRARPGDGTARTMLFELLCYSGDLARAEKQLAAMEYQGYGGSAVIGVRYYRNLIAAERARARLFAEGERPRFMLEPPEGVLLHLEAIDRLREGRPDEARGALDRASEGQAGFSGTAGGAPFGEFRDADDLLAPVLEVFTATGYFWVPWEHIQYLEVPPPRSLRDLLWTPANLATHDGQLGEVTLPGLYPGSSNSTDGEIRLGRKTDWAEPGAGIVRGLGRKLFLVGDDARTLLELGEVRFTYSGEDEAEGPSAGATPTGESA